MQRDGSQPHATAKSENSKQHRDLSLDGCAGGYLSLQEQKNLACLAHFQRRVKCDSARLCASIQSLGATRASRGKKISRLPTQESLSDVTCRWEMIASEVGRHGARACEAGLAASPRARVDPCLVKRLMLAFRPARSASRVWKPRRSLRRSPKEAKTSRSLPQEAGMA